MTELMSLLYCYLRLRVACVGLRGGMREHRKSNMTLTVMSTIGHMKIRKIHVTYRTH